eukprot:ANDGO_05073.mRNA.1 hypothetical protein
MVLRLVKQHRSFKLAYALVVVHAILWLGALAMLVCLYVMEPWVAFELAGSDTSFSCSLLTYSLRQGSSSETGTWKNAKSSGSVMGSVADWWTLMSSAIGSSIFMVSIAIFFLTSFLILAPRSVRTRALSANQAYVSLLLCLLCSVFALVSGAFSAILFYRVMSGQLRTRAACGILEAIAPESSCTTDIIQVSDTVVHVSIACFSLSFSATALSLVCVAMMKKAYSRFQKVHAAAHSQ